MSGDKSMDNKTVVEKTVKQLLLEHLEQTISGADLYKQSIVKQITAYEDEVAKMKEAIKDFESKLSNIKRMKEYVEKSK